jgi:hypothetical protein
MESTGEILEAVRQDQATVNISADEVAKPHALIGRVVGTERQPNTAFQFHFWAHPDAPIGIGTLVVVESAERKVWGVVVEGYGYNDVQNPMFDYLGAEANPETQAPTERPEIRVYSAAVLRHEPETLVQPVPIAPVFLAGEQDVVMALRMDAIPEDRRIPVGLYESSGLQAPVYVDSDFLMGPEAGHMNVTGTSGLAAKTSAIECIIQSIFQKSPRRVAALCFNVKGGDLLFLDQQPVHELSHAEREMYQRLQVRPEPFQKVEYYAPFQPDRVNLATLRTHPHLTHNLKPLLWGLREVMRFTEVLVNKDDIDVKADAFLQFLRQRAIEPGRFRFNNEEIGHGLPEEIMVTNFAELVTWFDVVLRFMEGTNKRFWRSYAIETIRKIQNRLANLTTRFAGLVAESTEIFDLPWGQFEDRTMYVIDVAQISSEAQDLIFTRMVAELRERMERRDLGVDTVIVVVDELNQYAPAYQRDTYVLRTLREICARGRYLGLVLFGAQQFRSQVDKQVVGNCSTSFYGRIEMEELAQNVYQIFDPAVKEKMGALTPGELLVRHPHFTQPVFIKFPRPAIMRGQDGLHAFPPEKPEPLERAIWRNLHQLDSSIMPNQVADIIVRTAPLNSPPDKDAVIRAMHTIMQERPAPGEVLKRFDQLVPKQPPRKAMPDARDLESSPYPAVAGSEEEDELGWDDDLENALREIPTNEDDPFL